MKMTMHIDEHVLSAVMELTGASSKTEAVRVALNDIARRAKFKKLAGEGLGMSADELRNVLEDGPADEESARVAEAPAMPRDGAKRSRR